MSNLTKPKQYEDDFNNEYDNYKIIVDNIQKIYPNYRLDEQNTNLTNELADDNSNLSQSHSRLFLLKNNLDNDSTKLRSINNNMIDQINELDKDIEKLKKKYNNLLNSNNAAKYAIYDFRFSYIEQLIYNVILGIILVSTVFYKYKNK